MLPVNTDLTNLSDHDLLIVLHEQVKGLRSDIQNLSDVSTKQLTDHETRLRSLEQKVWIWSGAAGIIGAVISFLASYFFK